MHDLWLENVVTNCISGTGDTLDSLRSLLLFELLTVKAGLVASFGLVDVALDGAGEIFGTFCNDDESGITGSDDNILEESALANVDKRASSGGIIEVGE